MKTLQKYIGRQNDLTNRLNQHLKKLTGLDKDFVSTFNQTDLLELKTVLADIHNLLTLNMTVSAINWLCNYFQLDSSCKQTIHQKVNDIKPNTKGYDIHLTDPKKIIAEVKCISPVNNGDKFGSAQWNSILDDAIKLKNGKGNITDTSDYYKFLFLVDLGARTEKAVQQLIRQSKGTSDKPLRANRHKIKEHISLLGDTDKRGLLTVDKVFIKTIKLN